MTAETFARSFAHAFAMQDANAITALLADNGELLSLTGQLAEGQKAAQSVLAAEFEGIFARARLVTGKGHIRPLGTGRALLRQRFGYRRAGCQWLGDEPISGPSYLRFWPPRQANGARCTSALWHFLKPSAPQATPVPHPVRPRSPCLQPPSARFPLSADPPTAP